MAAPNAIEVPVKAKLDLGPADVEFLTGAAAELRDIAQSAHGLCWPDDFTGGACEYLAEYVTRLANSCADLVEKLVGVGTSEPVAGQWHYHDDIGQCPTPAEREHGPSFCPGHSEAVV